MPGKEIPRKRIRGNPMKLEDRQKQRIIDLGNWISKREELKKKAFNPDKIAGASSKLKEALGKKKLWWPEIDEAIEELQKFVRHERKTSEIIRQHINESEPYVAESQIRDFESEKLDHKRMLEGLSLIENIIKQVLEKRMIEKGY